MNWIIALLKDLCLSQKVQQKEPGTLDIALCGGCPSLEYCNLNGKMCPPKF